MLISQRFSIQIRLSDYGRIRPQTAVSSFDIGNYACTRKPTVINSIKKRISRSWTNEVSSVGLSVFFYSFINAVYFLIAIIAKTTPMAATMIQETALADQSNWLEIAGSA